MKKLATLFTDSYRELFRVRTITLCAMFGALSIVLGYFTIRVGDYFNLGFAGLANELVHFIFGPVVGGVFGGVMDILKYIINPSGAFFFGFTFNAILAGVIYGAFWYKRPLSFARVMAARLVVIVVCNLLLNTLWLSMLSGKGFLVLLGPRVLKNLIMWPVDSLVLVMVAGALERSGFLKELRKAADFVR